MVLVQTDHGQFWLFALMGHDSLIVTLRTLCRTRGVPSPGRAAVLLDPVHHAHPSRHVPEVAVKGRSSEPALPTTMKNWLPSLLGLPELAIDTAPAVYTAVASALPSVETVTWPTMGARGVPALVHEVGDDEMERRAVVEVVASQEHEVVDRDPVLCSGELDRYGPDVGNHYRRVNLGPFMYIGGAD